MSVPSLSQLQLSFSTVLTQSARLYCGQYIRTGGGATLAVIRRQVTDELNDVFVVQHEVVSKDPMEESMSQSIRFLLRGVRGRHRQNFNWPGVIRSRQSVVHITAGEATLGSPSEVLGPNGSLIEQDWVYHLGDANVWVSNISPHDDAGGGGGVEFIVNVDFSAPLDVGVTITVEDRTPVEIQN